MMNKSNEYIRLSRSNYSFERSNLIFSQSLTVFIAILASVMSLITIVGNVLVIIAFIIEKSLRKYSNYFILNLSIADLLIGILIPPYTSFLLYKRQWMFGHVACTLWLVFDYVVGSASALCVVVISMDRYLLVSQGLNYVAGKKISKAICIMLTVWTIAFMNYAPAIIFWELISGRRTVKEGECHVEFHDNLVFLTATACVEFFVPLVSICTLNLAVYLNIRKRSRGLIRSKDQKLSLASSSVIQISALQKNKLVKSRLEKNEASKNGKASNKMKDSLLQTSLGAVEKNQKRNLSLSISTSTYSLFNFSAKQKDFSANRKIDKDTISLSRLDSNNKNIPSNQIETPYWAAPHKIGENALSNELKITKFGSSNLLNTFSPSKLSLACKNRRQANKQAKNSLTKDKKAARSLFILVFVFVICWAPYTSLTLIKAVCPSCVNDSIYELAFWLLWFNSTFNPILYPFLHVEFRKAFKTGTVRSETNIRRNRSHSVEGHFKILIQKFSSLRLISGQHAGLRRAYY